MEDLLKNSIREVVQGKVNKETGDALLKVAKNRGYVKAQCSLPGGIVMALINEDKNPCEGCNITCLAK